MTHSNRLPVLAAEIRKAHAGVQNAAIAGVGWALAAGEALAEAKSLLTHGRWLLWLREHCAISERSAQRYMGLARHKDEIKAKSDSMADLTITEALRLLDDRTEPQRALASQVELDTMRHELDGFANNLATADAAGLQHIINRCPAIEMRSAEIRIRATRKVGELMRELDIDAEGLAP